MSVVTEWKSSAVTFAGSGSMPSLSRPSPYVSRDSVRNVTLLGSMFHRSASFVGAGIFASAMPLTL